MIFNLELVEVANSERIFLNLISRQPHSYGPVRALLDTGSPTTILSARDALKLNVPLSGAIPGDLISGFGRGHLPSKKLPKFHFALKSKENEIRYLEMPINVIDVPSLNKMPQDYQNSAFQLPSIIGMDFLRISGLKLFVDLAMHNAILEG